MGGSKRRRQREEGGTGKEADVDCKDMCTNENDGIIAYIESSKDTSYENHDAPTSYKTKWTVDYVENIKKISPKCASSSESITIPSVMDVGLQMVRGGLERISNQKNKKNKKKNADVSSYEVKVKPTPIQLRLWPALLESFESKSSSEESSRALNVVGIAPTGSGKTKTQ